MVFSYSTSKTIILVFGQYFKRKIKMKIEGQQLSSGIVYTYKYFHLIPPPFWVGQPSFDCYVLFLFAWIELCTFFFFFFYQWFTIFGVLPFCSAVLIILSPYHHSFLHLLTVAFKQSYLLSLGHKSHQMILTLWKEDKSLKLFTDFINIGTAVLNKYVFCLI